MSSTFCKKESGSVARPLKREKLTGKNYKVFTNDAKMSMIVVAHRFKNERLGRGGPGSISTPKPWEKGFNRLDIQTFSWDFGESA